MFGFVGGVACWGEVRFCLSGVVWVWLGCGLGRLGLRGTFLSGAVLSTFLARGVWGHV